LEPVGKTLNIKGKRYGKLTVLELIGTGSKKGTRWLCLCDCGKERVVRVDSLRNNRTRSCGCLKKQPVPRVYIEGTKILDHRNTSCGMYIKVIEVESYEKPYTWRCLCVCGKEIIKTHRSLSYPYTNPSCGCKNLTKQPDWHCSVFTHEELLYKNYKKNAEAKKINFAISLEDFTKTISKTCSYCGCAPSTYFNPRRIKADTLVYNGVDRIDSTKGYSVDNITPCCKVCNYMKLRHTKDFFLDHVRKIYTHQNLGRSGPREH